MPDGSIRVKILDFHRVLLISKRLRKDPEIYQVWENRKTGKRGEIQDIIHYKGSKSPSVLVKFVDIGVVHYSLASTSKECPSFVSQFKFIGVTIADREQCLRIRLGKYVLINRRRLAHPIPTGSYWERKSGSSKGVVVRVRGYKKYSHEKLPRHVIVQLESQLRRRRSAQNYSDQFICYMQREFLKQFRRIEV
jgi:hypothetical protein